MAAHPGIKRSKIVEKHIFEIFFTPQPPSLPIASFHRPINGLQLSYDITHDTLYTNDPI
jgi:hypothetical protein